MPVYYNEIDPYCVQWLKNLIAQGTLPDGWVDDTPVQHIDVQKLKDFSSHHFFAGLGGWPHAIHNLSGIDPGIPLFTGSIPCQPFSLAGKQQGVKDERHLWPVWFSIIQQLHPPILFSEQVPKAVGHGWYDEVAANLESEGYSVAAVVLPATACNAWHVRERLWIVAYSNRNFESWYEQYSRTPRRVGKIKQPVSWNRPWETALSELRVVDNGIPRRVAATDAIRNSIVPQVASLFVEQAIQGAKECLKYT